MKTRIPVTVLLMLVAALVAVPAGPLAQSTDEILLKQALDLERAKGDVAGAIEIYKRLAQSKDLRIGAAAREALKRLDPTPPVQRLASADNPRRISGEAGFAINGPRFSSSGRYVVGLGLSSGMDLHWREVDTAQERRLYVEPGGFASNGQSIWDFSPDERYVAALLWKPITQAQIEDVKKGALKGDEIPVAGRLVVVATAAGAKPAFVLPLPSMVPPRFPGDLAWSPDSSRLAFVAPGSKESAEVQILDLKSGQASSTGIPVFVRPAKPAHGFIPPLGAFLRWSPAGDRLAVHIVRDGSSPDELRILDIRTGSTRSVPVDGAPDRVTRIGRWLRDDAMLAVQGGPLQQPALAQKSGVVLLNPDTGSAKTICSGQGPNSALQSLVDVCVYTFARTQRQLVWRHESKRLTISDVAIGSDQPVSRGSGEEYFASVSPDESRVAFISNREGRWGVYVASLAAGPAEPIRLSWLDAFPTWFSVATWHEEGFIARADYRDRNVWRVTVNPDTGKPAGAPERLTQESSVNSAPAVSPDGRTIEYWAKRGASHGAAVMDAMGNNERLVKDAVLETAFQPSWRKEFFALDTDRQTVIGKSLAVGRTERLARIDPGSRNVSWVVVSRDRAKVAYILNDNRNDFGCNPTCDVGVLDVATGSQRTVATVGGFPGVAAFSPDNRFLLYGAGQPRVVEVATGQWWALAMPGEKPVAWDVTNGADWSPDGTFIVFTLTQPRTEWTAWRVR